MVQTNNLADLREEVKAGVFGYLNNEPPLRREGVSSLEQVAKETKMGDVLDSLGFYNFLLDVEDRYDVVVSAGDYAALSKLTVGQMIDYIVRTKSSSRR